MCVVSYPSCPSFAPSPEDVSCFKFVADDMVASMRDDAERCLGKDISSYLNDRSFVTDRILSEKEKEMCYFYGVLILVVVLNWSEWNMRNGGLRRKISFWTLSTSRACILKVCQQKESRWLSSVLMLLFSLTLISRTVFRVIFTIFLLLNQLLLKASH